MSCRSSTWRLDPLSTASVTINTMVVFEGSLVKPSLSNTCPSSSRLLTSADPWAITLSWLSWLSECPSDWQNNSICLDLMQWIMASRSVSVRSENCSRKQATCCHKKHSKQNLNKKLQFTNASSHSNRFPAIIANRRVCCPYSFAWDPLWATKLCSTLPESATHQAEHSKLLGCHEPTSHLIQGIPRAARARWNKTLRTLNTWQRHNYKQQVWTLQLCCLKSAARVLACSHCLGSTHSLSELRLCKSCVEWRGVQVLMLSQMSQHNKSFSFAP